MGVGEGRHKTVDLGTEMAMEAIIAGVTACVQIDVVVGVSQLYVYNLATANVR